MKRLFGVLVLSLAFGLLCVRPAVSQTRGIGLRGGINLANFVGADAADDRSKLGLNLGGSFRLISIGPVSITPEVYYAQKGSIQELMDPTAFEPGSAGQPELTFSLAYIEVPVLVQVALPLGGDSFRPYLQAGPALAWNLDCEIEFSESDTSDRCDSLSEENLEETIRDFEQGVVFGGGTDIRLPRRLGAVNLDARLTRGLSRLTEETEISNQAFTFMLGYWIGF